MALKSSNDMSAFQEAKQGPFKDAWETKIRPFLEDIPNDWSDILQHVVDYPRTAGFATSEAVMNSNQYKNCDIVLIPRDYMTHYSAFGTQKDFHYKGIIDYYLRKLIEDGSVSKMKRRHSLTSNVKCTRGQKKGHAMGFNIALPAIIIITIGFIISTIFLLLELILCK